MKRSVAVIAALAAVIAAGILWPINVVPPAPADTDRPSVLVGTIRLARGTLPATVSAYGSIGAGPGAELTVTTPGGGLVAAVPVVTGETVAAGTTLVLMAADPNSVAALANAENALAAARANRAHVVALLKSRLATNADLANADQVFNDAAAALAALRATGTGTNRTVTAPVVGVVSAVLVGPGTLQPAGAALLRMIDTERLVATVGVPPAQAATLKQRDAAAITLLDGGTRLAGRVAQASAILDPATGLTDVTIAVTGTAPLGAPVQAVITTGSLAGFVVPRDAVQSDEQGDYAFQVDPSSIARRVTVDILGHEGDRIVLAPDLDVARPLVTTGAYQLEDGVAVRLANAPRVSN